MADDDRPPHPNAFRVALRAIAAAAVIVFVPLLVDHRFDWPSAIGLVALLAVLAAWQHRHHFPLR